MYTNYNNSNNIYSKNDLNNGDISTWTTDDAIVWLKFLRLQQYTESFYSNHINGYDLCFITNEELKSELNIIKLHDRNVILKGIRELILRQCKVTK